MGNTSPPSSPGLQVHIEGAVCTLTFDRPAHSNGIDYQMHTRLQKIWGEFVDMEAVRAIVLTGAGHTFSAGGDLSRMLTNIEDPASPARMMRQARELITEMVRCPIPIVAAVNGPAVGMGANIALLADIVLMSETAYLADPHVAIGLACGDGGAAVWPAIMALPAAKRYLFTGDRITAAEAYRIGLASEVHPRADLMSAAQALAVRLAVQPARALQDTKRAVNCHLERHMVGALDAAAFAEQVSLSSPEYVAAVRRLAAGVTAEKHE